MAETATIAAIIKDAPDGPTLATIKRWPAAVSIPRACTALGISKSHGYELARSGEFPARIITLSGRYVVVTADLVRILGGGEDGTSAAA